MRGKEGSFDHGGKGETIEGIVREAKGRVCRTFFSFLFFFLPHREYYCCLLSALLPQLRVLRIISLVSSNVPTLGAASERAL